MQIFLFGALAVSLVAVLFALQNIVPVTVTFFLWTFEGSLAIVLFIALVAGALISSLASVPTLFRGRRAATQLRQQVASLQTRLDDTERRLRDAERRPTDEGDGRASLPAGPTGSDPSFEPPS